MAYRAVKASVILSCLANVTWASDIMGGETLAAMDGLFNEQVMEMPQVLTAARLRQSQLDTPASVTVIEADTIAALGFKNIEEIFRLVPGMLVGYHSGFGEKMPSVSYHGTNAPEHRRLQVLIDGRSVFKPGLARVEWVDIPLAVEDIARIEVIRGPNSAAYGANSYLGVINILTKHPQDDKSTTVKMTSGNRDVRDLYINVGSQIGSTDISWTVGKKQKSGFVFQDLKTDNRDGSEAIYSTVRTFTPLTSKMSLDFQMGYQDGIDQQRPIIGELYYLSDEDISAQDTFVTAKLNLEYSTKQFAHFNMYSQKFYREQEWQACFIGTPYCGTIDKNLDEAKSEIEYQHTSTWNSQFRTVMGARARKDELDSDSFNGGHSENNNYSVFANAEYKMFENVVTNLGGMYEKDDLNGENFSPRIAFNYHLSNAQTLRFIYSEAIRSPDIFEMSGQAVYTLRDVYDPSGSVTDLEVVIGEADGNLDNETIYSHEISYFALINSLGLQLDVKLFYDRLSGLIPQGLDHSDPLTNEISLIMQGIEGTIKWEINRYNSLRLTYAYVDTNSDANYTSDMTATELEDKKILVDRQVSLSADKSGSLSWIGKVSDAFNFGIAYYHVENWNPGNDSLTFSRIDTNMSYDWLLAGQKQLRLQGTVQERLDDNPILYGKNNYATDTHYYVSLQFKY